VSDFKAKCIKFDFRPRPHWKAYSVPPDHLAVFKGPTSKHREGKEKGRRRERKRVGDGTEGMGERP